MKMYTELAEWWPLLSEPADYAEEAAFVRGLIETAGAREVLELGSGGGHMASHLTSVARFTLVDLSPQMLDVSLRLNPDCEHIEGDMRDLRLGRTFDAVFVHDAVMYMTTEANLAAAIATAFVHCRPGGIAIFEPDCTSETFVAETDHGGADAPDGRGVRYLSWTWDPDPTDTEAQTVYAFVCRHADGTITSEHETHHWGLFPRAEWIRLLRDAGFDAESVYEETPEDRPMRELFIGRRSAEVDPLGDVARPTARP